MSWRNSGTTVRTTTGPAATEDLGRRIAEELEPGDVLLLVGELAAGKTTLVRGLAHGLGADPEGVSSPTFVLIQTYPCSRIGILRLHHVDLYRLKRRQEMVELGLEELVADPAAVTAVEWPRDLVDPALPAATTVWRIELEAVSERTRKIRVHGP